MKPIGFFALLFVLVTSLFKLWGANLTGNVLAVALMILLISMFTDLQEFDFWGLRGKKEENALLAEAAGWMREAINENIATRPTTREEIERAQQEAPVQLMDSSTGNFLAFAFEIERLLRIASIVILDNESPRAHQLVRTKQLKETGFLTESGAKQVDGVRWLRNMLIRGRAHEVSEETLFAGTQVAESFYNEISDWVRGLEEHNSTA